MRRDIINVELVFGFFPAARMAAAALTIRKAVWEGAIPVCFRLARHEVAATVRACACGSSCCC